MLQSDLSSTNLIGRGRDQTRDSFIDAGGNLLYGLDTLDLYQLTYEYSAYHPKENLKQLTVRKKTTRETN